MNWAIRNDSVQMVDALVKCKHKNSISSSILRIGFLNGDPILSLEENDDNTKINTSF